VKKYTFSEKTGKKVTKYEIVAETLTEAQMLLAEKLETIKGINVVGVGLPDYIEPIDPPTDLTLKTFNITYRPDKDVHDDTETVTYKALSLNSAEGQFLEDFPDQAGQYRETHMPLSNYAVDRENEEKKNQSNIPGVLDMGVYGNLFTKTTAWVKLFTTLFLGLIGLGLVSAALFGIDGGFGMVENISTLVSSLGGLTGLIVLFLVYYLFIRCGDKEKT
jgi:hypothetical protein